MAFNRNPQLSYLVLMSDSQNIIIQCFIFSVFSCTSQCVEQNEVYIECNEVIFTPVPII